MAPCSRPSAWRRASCALPAPTASAAPRPHRRRTSTRRAVACSAAPAASPTCASRSPTARPDSRCSTTALPIGGAVPPASGYYAQITAPATGGLGDAHRELRGRRDTDLAHARDDGRDRGDHRSSRDLGRRRRRGRDRHLGQHERHRPAVPAQGRDARAARARGQERPARRGGVRRQVRARLRPPGRDRREQRGARRALPTSTSSTAAAPTTTSRSRRATRRSRCRRCTTPRVPST